ncbi:MAG TPA: 50S ribosomal protein L15 [Rhabdochlamydiaceae bacterium]
MITLSTLRNTSRPSKKVQRVGRGPGSGRGKTCGKGHKGDKARCGYKVHDGREGGQLPLYRRMPCRGFGNSRFASTPHSINLGLIEQIYENGEVVNHETLRAKGYAPRENQAGIKILSHGDLTKKVTIEARSFSKGAIEKLEKLAISYKVV